MKMRPSTSRSLTNRSLTNNLVGGVLLAELLCAGLFSGVAIAHELRGRRHAFDIMLRGRADSVLGAVQDADDPDDNVIVDQSALALPAEDIYEVVGPSLRTIGHSTDASPEKLSVLASSHANGYFNIKVDGTAYRALRVQGVRVVDQEKNGGVRRPVTILYASPTAHLWHEVVEAVQFYVLASVLLLAVTGFVLAWFLRRWLSPLRLLALRAGLVSTRSWDFLPPVEALRTKELEPIASAIQKLLQGLKQSFERQRQFTGDAAHELKTSIAVLKSSLQLLSMRRRTVDDYEKGMLGLLADVQRMEDLVSRMLALARIEEAPAQQGEFVDLSSLVRSVAERLHPLTELKQVNLEIIASEVHYIALGSTDGEVLCENLMMNALQHSRPHGRVCVTVVSGPKATELRLVDQGFGIPEEALPHVFERFYRVDTSRSRHSGGAGLGLAMCKAIAERCNGKIEIKSTFGLGTEVTVTLPSVR